MTSPMWSTSSRVPWKALLAVTAASTSQIGWMPALARRLGGLDDDGGGAHAEDHAVAAAVEREGGFLDHVVGGGGARWPGSRTPIQSSSVSDVTSSAATTTTRRQRPARIQSSARAMACVVLAQAALTCVFGPRAPMSSANCEWPIERTRNRKRRSNSIGLRLAAAGAARRCAGRSRRPQASASRDAGLAPLRRRGELSAAAGLVRVVALDVGGERVEARERRGEDDAGVVAQRVGQPPPLGQLGARCVVVL